MPSHASLRFPCSRVLLSRTRLAYIHLRNLLNDAKRDRAARISGYVEISLPDELLILYLLDGEAVNATVRGAEGTRALNIATAIDLVPAEPEYGEVCFHEADEEQLACMFATHVKSSEPWPEGMKTQDSSTLFPYLIATTFDGFLEIVAGDAVNYLIFRDGSVVRAFLAGTHEGTLVERVSKLFGKGTRPGEPRVTRWAVPAPLPRQAPPALVEAYRDLATTLVEKLVAHGRESAGVIAEHARQNLLVTYPVLDAFSLEGKPAAESLDDTAGLTVAVAAWMREVIWAAADHETVSPDGLLKELTWERRHMFQSAGFYEQMPWKVM